MSRTSPWKAVAAGAVGGLAASFVMGQFQNAWSQASKKLKKPGEGAEPMKEHDQPATVKTADAIATKVFHRELTEEQKKIAAQAVHYAFGALNGMLYAAAAEYTPFARVARGTAFGAGLWAAADELAVPALKLSKSPKEYPASTHMYALTSHLVYGITLDLVSRGVRSALSRS